jgi:hypothetical protein
MGFSGIDQGLPAALQPAVVGWAVLLEAFPPHVKNIARINDGLGIGQAFAFISG